MPAEPFALQIIDVMLLVAGTGLIVGGALAVSLRRQWGQLLTLPPAPTNRLDATDVLIAVAIVVLWPSIIVPIVAIFEAESTVSPQPVVPGAALSPSEAIGGAVAQAIAILALLAIGRTNFSGGLSGWGLSGRNHPRRVLQAVAGYVAVCPLCFGLLALSGAVLHALGIEVRRHDTIAALQDPTLSPWLRTLIIFNAFVLAASVEELFFRGLLQPALVRFLGRTWMAVLVGGILFGLIHLQFLDTVAPLAAFGIVLGYLYAKTGSLTLVIFLHAIFNGKTLLWIVLGAS